MPDSVLQVDLLVPAPKGRAFERLSAEFHRKHGFERLLGDVNKRPPRYELLLALRSTSTFPYLPPGRASGTSASRSAFTRHFYRQSVLAPVTKVYRYVHLWKIRDDADLDLTPVMRACGDDPLYLSIDALVVEETQNFISRVRTPGDIAKFTKARRFIRTTRKLNHDDVGVYVLTEPMLYPSLEESGVHHLGQYQTFSGLLNVVVEYWQTTTKGPLDKMFAAVQRPQLPPNAPAQALTLFETDVRESFVKLPYSPRGPSL